MRSLSKVKKFQQDNASITPFAFPEYGIIAEVGGDEENPQTPEESVEELCEQILGQAKDEALEILEEAKAQAKAMLEEAKDTKAKAYEVGFQTGMEQGLAEGNQKGYEEQNMHFQEELEKFHDETAKFIEGMHRKKEQVLEAYIDDLKKISLAVAEKIIRTSLKSSGEIVKRMIISATEKLKRTQWAKIYITKGDSSRLVHGDASLIQELSHLSSNIKIVVMDHEEDGNCIVELPDEIIDISINTQLQNIKDILNNAKL